MKRNKFWSTYIFLWLTCLLLVALPILDIYKIESDFLVSYEDVNSANENHLFGSFINGELKQKESEVSTGKTKNGEIVFKLFGFIPIRKVSVVMTNDDDYYIGGVPIGLSIQTDGGIVVSSENSLKEGDIVTKINGVDFEDIEDFQSVLSKSTEAEVTYLRNNKEIPR